MPRYRYYLDRAGNLYRVRGAKGEMFSRFLAQDWTVLQLPLRHAKGLREISGLRAWVSVTRRRCAQAWFAWRVSC